MAKDPFGEKKRQLLHDEIMQTLALDSSLASMAVERLSTLSTSDLERIAKQLRHAEIALADYLEGASTSDLVMMPVVEVVAGPVISGSAARASTITGVARSLKAGRKAGWLTGEVIHRKVMKRIYNIAKMKAQADISRKQAEDTAKVVEKYLKLVRLNRVERKQGGRLTRGGIVEFVLVEAKTTKSGKRLVRKTVIDQSEAKSGRKSGVFFYRAKKEAREWLATKVAEEVGLDKEKATKAVFVTLQNLGRE